jgi:carbamoyl-phosphate synthase small subunit
MTSQGKPVCKLALEDGTVFVGTSFGGRGTRFGEVVFNTSMMGYQEILTDPSYRGQIVVMTCPQIGNYGVTDEDVESKKPWVEGFAVKELARRHSNFRAGQPLDHYLTRHGVISIEGIDTRALTRRLRIKGSLNGVISTEPYDEVELVRMAVEAEDIVGKDLVQSVAPGNAYDWKRGFESPFAMQPRGARTRFDVIALDFGIKQNILRNLVEAGCRVLVVPPTEPAEAILQRKPDGIFLSNGPGDPEPVRYARETIAHLVGKVPIFGICLGHQLLGMALGADRYKLKFGHHGGNQPVKNLATGRVEITAQNHCYAIDTDSLRKVGALPTHVNLNDQTLEGFTHPDVPLFSVQYHPEASPGPHDATYLFDCFVDMMTGGRAPTAEQMAEAQKRLESRR